jgi:hypothetical protein
VSAVEALNARSEHAEAEEYQRLRRQAHEAMTFADREALLLGEPEDQVESWVMPTRKIVRLNCKSFAIFRAKAESDDIGVMTEDQFSHFNKAS